MRGLTQGGTAGSGAPSLVTYPLAQAGFSAQPCNNPANATNEVSLVCPRVRWC